MRRILSMILAVMLLCSLTIPAFADVSDAAIDPTRTGSVNLWKYDLSSAQADGVWDSSYVSTGIRDQSGVEAILGASGSSSGYAIEGVVYTYLKVAELKSVTVTDNDVERSELMYGIVNNAANTAFLTAIGVSVNDRYAAADNTTGGVTMYYYRSDTLIAGLQNALTGNATTVKNALETYVVNNGGTAMPATDANGHSAASDLPLGLYLFVETSVPEMVTSTTAPFLISIPMTSTTASGSSWIYDVVVYPKNLTGLPTLDKTVREAKTSSGKNNGSAAITDGFAESATASAGDTVEYYLTGSFNTTENMWYVTGKTAEASAATHFVPTAAGKLTVKGLEDDAYTLTEVKTDSAYTLLKAPVQVVISKSGATVSATVDGKAVNMSAIGTSGHALAPFTIINTRGFDLPQTGGTGNWLFPVIGMVMLAVCITGIIILTKKKPTEN